MTARRPPEAHGDTHDHAEPETTLWQALERDLNLPQLVSIFMIVMGAAWWTISQNAERDKQQALSQQQITQVVAHAAATDTKIDGLSAKVDAQALTLTTVVAGQQQGREKIDSVRDDIQRLTVTIEAQRRGK